MMKAVDKSIELVVCVRRALGMRTYMDWDRQVLEYLAEQADYIASITMWQPGRQHSRLPRYHQLD